MDTLFDKATTSVLKMIDFANLAEALIFIVVVAVLRILHIFAAGWVMKTCGLRSFKSMGLTLEAQPANETTKLSRSPKRLPKDDAA